MPLSRIALQSPAGAARGQVNNLPFEFVLLKAFKIMQIHYFNGQNCVRLMISKMKQKSFQG